MIIIGITCSWEKFALISTNQDVMYVTWKMSISQETVVLQMMMMISLCILHFLYDLFMLVVWFLKMLVETDGAIYSRLSGCNSSPSWAFCVLFSTRPCQMLSQEPIYVTKNPVTNMISV